MKEGLDRLAAEQAQAGQSSDLFDVVQRFLDDGPKTGAGRRSVCPCSQALEEFDSKLPPPKRPASRSCP